MCIVHVSWNKAISIAKVQHRCVEPSTILIERVNALDYQSSDEPLSVWNTNKSILYKA